MAYRHTRPGERGLGTMGQFNLPGGWPGFPGMLPGPIQIHPGPAGPNVAGGLFPTHTRVGDVVTVTGPFGGFGQGQVRVRFQGTSWLYPQLMGPTTGSVVVPEGAENGLCEVELNGRTIFGTNCIVEKGVERVGRPSHGGRDAREWTERGELVGLKGFDSVYDLGMVAGAAAALYGHLKRKPTTFWLGAAALVICGYTRMKKGA